VRLVAEGAAECSIPAHSDSARSHRQPAQGHPQSDDQAETAGIVAEGGLGADWVEFAVRTRMLAVEAPLLRSMILLESEASPDFEFGVGPFPPGKTEICLRERFSVDAEQPQRLFSSREIRRPVRRRRRLQVRKGARCSRPHRTVLPPGT